VVWPALVAGAAAWAWWIFEDWRNDVYIIAPDRIIDIHRLPLLFRQTRREAALDRVQTIEAIIPSSVARFLKYGTVNVAIPGSTFQLKDVSNPAAIQIEISRRIEAYKRSQAQAAERGRRSELSDWFAVYDQIRQGYRPPGTLGAGERGNHGSA